MGRISGEAQWKPRQTHLRCAAPHNAQELMAKLLLTPLVSILLLLYLPALRIPLFRILPYVFYCNYPAGQQQAPCPSFKNISWCEQPTTSSGEGKRGEMITAAQRHRCSVLCTSKMSMISSCSKIAFFFSSLGYINASCTAEAVPASC